MHHNFKRDQKVKAVCPIIYSLGEVKMNIEQNQIGVITATPHGTQHENGYVMVLWNGCTEAISTPHFDLQAFQ